MFAHTVRARFAPALAAAVLALGLVACSQDPVPKDAFYRLDVPDARPVAATPVFEGKAEVRPLTADGVLRQRPVVFIAAGAQALEQYSYHFWAEPPAEMVQRELTDALRTANLFQTVVTPEFRVRTDYEVQGRLARFEQVLDGDGARFVAEMELAANRKRGMELLLMKTYRSEKAAPSATVEDASSAARAALSDIFTQFISDLAALR